MKTPLEKLYWELRKSAQDWTDQFRIVNLTENASLPEGLNFSSRPLSLLNSEWLLGFVAHPQVNSILYDAVCYCFLFDNEESGASHNAALLDKACNRCIEILQKYYKGGDDEAAAFRRFWELLMLPLKLPDSNLPFPIELGFLPGIERLEKKLDREIQQDFVEETTAYVKTLLSYRKALATYYQKGFIYLLGEFRFNDFYIPPELSGRLQDFSTYIHSLSRFPQNREKWKDIFNKDDILYLVGAPGSGKSLFLRNLINNYGEMSFYNSREYLIIYCDMKTYYTNGNSNKKSIPEFLQETIINTTGMEKTEISMEFIRYYLQTGRCMVLMDALDEVPKANRMALHKKVVSYFKAAHPNNKVCITSRARGFLPQEEIEVLYISELTAQDISDYLDKMIALDRFKGKDKNRFLAQAQVLIEKHFLTNFLILSLMVNIYKAERELPENKIELYKKCFEYIAKKREMEKGSKVSYDWNLVVPLMKDSTFISLSTLAAPNNMDIPREKIETMLLKQYQLKYNNAVETENAIQQFLDFCSSRTEMFVLADTDEKFKFFHRSFFEYFYSRYITQQASVPAMYRLMAQFDVDSEVFELTIALVKEDNEEKYQELINYILTEAAKELKNTPQQYTAFKILTLSMQVIDDVYFRKEYIQLVLKNPALMTSRAIHDMDQKQTAQVIRKILQALPEETNMFCQIYRNHYISFVMEQVGAASRKNIEAFLSNYEALRNKKGRISIPPLLPHGSTVCLRVYPDADALQEEVIHWGPSEIATFLSMLPNSKEKRRIHAGFKRFGEYTILEREKLWKWFAKQELPEVYQETFIVSQNHDLNIRVH